MLFAHLFLRDAFKHPLQHVVPSDIKVYVQATHDAIKTNVAPISTNLTF